jgi:hypothetical protein
MVSQNLQRALQDVEALDTEERRQLLSVLETHGATAGAAIENRAEATLLAKGIIRRVSLPATSADLARHNAVKPVTIEGRSVSDSLIEDRR